MASKASPWAKQFLDFPHLKLFNLIQDLYLDTFEPRASASLVSLTTNRSMPLPKSPGRAKPVADFRHPQSLSSVSLSHPNQFSKWSHFGFALYANFGICLELWYCWETWLCDSLRIIAECSAYARWGLCVERPQVGNRALSSERWPEWQWSVCDKTRR